MDKLVLFFIFLIIFFLGLLGGVFVLFGIIFDVGIGGFGLNCLFFFCCFVFDIDLFFMEFFDFTFFLTFLVFVVFFKSIFIFILFIKFFVFLDFVDFNLEICDLSNFKLVFNFNKVLFVLFDVFR